LLFEALKEIEIVTDDSFDLISHFKSEIFLNTIITSFIKFSFFIENPYTNLIISNSNKLDENLFFDTHNKKIFSLKYDSGNIGLVESDSQSLNISHLVSERSENIRCSISALIKNYFVYKENFASSVVEKDGVLLFSVSSNGLDNQNFASGMLSIEGKIQDCNLSVEYKLFAHNYEGGNVQFNYKRVMDKMVMDDECKEITDCIKNLIEIGKTSLIKYKNIVQDNVLESVRKRIPYSGQKTNWRIFLNGLHGKRPSKFQ